MRDDRANGAVVGGSGLLQAVERLLKDGGGEVDAVVGERVHGIDRVRAQGPFAAVHRLSAEAEDILRRRTGIRHHVIYQRAALGGGHRLEQRVHGPCLIRVSHMDAHVVQLADGHLAGLVAKPLVLGQALPVDIHYLLHHGLHVLARFLAEIGLAVIDAHNLAKHAHRHVIGGLLRAGRLSGAAEREAEGGGLHAEVIAEVGGDGVDHRHQHPALHLGEGLVADQFIQGLKIGGVGHDDGFGNLFHQVSQQGGQVKILRLLVQLRKRLRVIADGGVASLLGGTAVGR